jgi:hypothetical protein
MLSRKYYQQMAEVLGQTNASESTIQGFERMALADNSRFNPDRFRNAVEKARLNKVV